MPSPQELEAALFALALEKPVVDRAAWLQTVCGEDHALRARLDALLAAHEATDGVLRDAPVQELLRSTIKVPVVAVAEEELGSRISHYKLLQKVGEGGCGVVYMAEQEEPVRRRVALKVIKLGMDTRAVVARFEAERQALAMMDHPNIAKVLDAGTTDKGRPFFVMELVRGIRITDYCDQNHLSTEARLELFISVCQAVQHAHQKGIIHRDLKPSNILVTLHDGVPVPKVIDFGIAKAIEQKLTDKTLFTELNQFMGTPAYMSPEQAEMSGLDIDTRSDIYSLGVLLYELLTGRTPFDGRALVKEGIEAIRRTIREVEPPRPSTRLSTLAHADLDTVAKARGTGSVELRSQLRGDLDWIVMKALEKDRTRRYETANGFAMDLKRHLADEPVLACPPSAAYKFQKAIRRNKLTFAAVGAVAAALVLGVVVSAWQAHRARIAERIATANAAAERAAREKAEAIAGFMLEAFRSPDPTRDGRTITVVELLDRAAKRLETDLARQPELQTELRATLARTYNTLSLHHKAIPLQEQVRDYYLASCGLAHSNTLQATELLANTCAMDGRPDEAHKALKLREQLLELRRKLNGPEHHATLATMQNLALSYNRAGRLEEGIRMLEQVVALRRKLGGPEDPDALLSVGNLATAYADVGRWEEALQMREAALAVARKNYGPKHPDTLLMMNNLAESYHDAGRLAQALKMKEELVKFQREVNGPEHKETLTAMNNLACAYEDTGRLEAALELLEEVLAVNRKVWGLEHPDTLLAMNNLAHSYHSAGRRGEALKLRQDVLTLQRKVNGPAHPETFLAMNNLALSYDAGGRQDEARKLWEEVLLLSRQGDGPELSITIMAMNNLAYSYLQISRTTEAMSLFQEANHRAPDDALAAKTLAALQVWFGMEAEHAALSQRMLQCASNTFHGEAAEQIAELASLRPSTNTALLEAALALAQRALEFAPTSHWRQMTLGMAEYRNGHYPEAEAVLQPLQAEPGPIGGTSAFYWAMSLFKQGKPTEARKLYAATEARIKILPANDAHPLAGKAHPDDLIVWLAFKEAKALLQIPATASKP